MADVKLLDDNGLKSLGPTPSLRLKVKTPWWRILTEILSRMLSIIVDGAQQKNQVAMKKFSDPHIRGLAFSL